MSSGSTPVSESVCQLASQHCPPACTLWMSVGHLHWDVVHSTPFSLYNAAVVQQCSSGRQTSLFRRTADQSLISRNRQLLTFLLIYNLNLSVQRQFIACVHGYRTNASTRRKFFRCIYIVALAAHNESRWWPLDGVYNSRLPLDRLFELCDPVTLTFDLILIDMRGLVMDYLCVKFGDFLFQPFWFYHAHTHTYTHTHTHTHTHRRR